MEIVEELIENTSFLADRVVSTSIELPVPRSGEHSRQLVRINSALIRAVLRRAENSDRNG